MKLFYALPYLSLCLFSIEKMSTDIEMFWATEKQTEIKERKLWCVYRKMFNTAFDATTQYGALIKSKFTAIFLDFYILV